MEINKGQWELAALALHPLCPDQIEIYKCFFVCLFVFSSEKNLQEQENRLPHGNMKCVE